MVMKSLIIVHRYVGVVLGVLMTVWCLSGFVMMYQPYPSTSQEEKLAGLESLDLSQCCANVTLAGDTTLGNARIEMLNGAPVLRMIGADGPTTLQLASGAALAPLATDAAFTVSAGDGVGGVATSGWRGRSHSRGIADSVTILAADAARADAAATVVANQVDVDHFAIVRQPAISLRDDSDLGDILVTVHVPPLPPEQVARALQRGLACAQALQARGLLQAALLVCQGSMLRLAPRALATAPATAPATEPAWLQAPIVKPPPAAALASTV